MNWNILRIYNMKEELSILLYIHTNTTREMNDNEY